jgi:hypothetical protein
MADPVPGLNICQANLATPTTIHPGLCVGKEHSLHRTSVWASNRQIIPPALSAPWKIHGTRDRWNTPGTLRVLWLLWLQEPCGEDQGWVLQGPRFDCTICWWFCLHLAPRSVTRHKSEEAAKARLESSIAAWTSFRVASKQEALN